MKGKPTPPVAGITQDGRRVSTPYLQFFNRIVDFVATLTQIGTAANRPAADTVYPGTVYFETDTGLQFISDGVAWFPFSAAAGITQLTGDVTAGPGSGAQAATIANDAVTFAKMQNIATQRFIGRNTAGTGSPEEVTIAQALGWIGAAAVQTTTVVVTDAQIKAATLSVDVIPAQGVGFAAFPLLVNVFGHFAAGAYANIDADAYGACRCNGWDLTSYLVNDSFGSSPMTGVDQLFGTAAVNYAAFAPYTNPDFDGWGSVAAVRPNIGAALNNNPLSFYVDNGGSGALTGGNAANTMTITAFYVVQAV